MIIEVLFFGQARDLADAGLQFAVAVNEVYAENQKAIQAGDVVAVLPPVSGG
jgi:sulfur carrier protein ThiS